MTRALPPCPPATPLPLFSEGRSPVGRVRLPAHPPRARRADRGHRRVGAGGRAALELRAQLLADPRSAGHADGDARSGDRPPGLHPDGRPSLPRAVPRRPGRRGARRARPAAPGRGRRRADGDRRAVVPDRDDVAAAGRGDRRARQAPRKGDEHGRRPEAQGADGPVPRVERPPARGPRRPPPRRARAQRGPAGRDHPAARRDGHHRRVGRRRAPGAGGSRPSSASRAGTPQSSASSPRRCR
jgi:hypothetical protein